MEIVFASRRLQKLGNSGVEATKALGERCGRMLQRRLAELAAAPTLAEMMLLPGPRCHALTGDRVGQFAVDLEHPRRLIFELAQDSRPERDDGSLDPGRVTRICIVEIVDYH